MGEVPLHPAIVHVPLGLSLVLPLVAFGVTVGLWRAWISPRAFWMVVALQAVVFGAGFVALETGEKEGERIERVVGKTRIHEHEEAAERFMVAAGVSLAVGIAGLFLMKREKALRWAAAGATAGTVAAAALALSAGKAGGELVYLHGAAAVYAQPVGPTIGDASRKHDDD
jgi:uncharacterized membrane protein